MRISCIFSLSWIFIWMLGISPLLGATVQIDTSQRTAVPYKISGNQNNEQEEAAPPLEVFYPGQPAPSTIYRGKIPTTPLPRTNLMPRHLERSEMPRMRKIQSPLEATNLERTRIQRSQLERNQGESSQLRRSPLPQERLQRAPLSR